MTLDQYIAKISSRYKQGNSTEHTFRGDLQLLLETLVPEIQATNEPKRQSCGAPDYIISKGEIDVGFIEAKDIGDKDLEGIKKTLNKEQFDRYKSGLSNLITTDYVDFLFYREGILNTRISLGKIEGDTIVPKPENFGTFTQLFKNFTETISQTIKSPTRLAEIMAGKAKLMADIIEKSLNHDDETGDLSNLKKQMLSFKQMLISDITNKTFSDLYSQTIAYGLFAARFHDPTLSNFSRDEAVKLIPKSNPFLRKLFKDIADDDLDNRLVWIIDELIRVFLASDVSAIMKDFGKSTKQEDPVIHFYETFLGAYNPELKKSRGVWYTPQPVVNFIVRAVDDILKTEFNLLEGLADKSKRKIKIPIHGKIIEKEIHQVQVLDPATGTGTFLTETIKHIHKQYEGMQGIWSKYVEDDLIPRINGFELLMASYAMAHLKLDMLLTETGYIPTRDQRLKVFLTNSLEEANPDSGTLWGNLLSEEADQANEVKRDTPIMCIIGNPPYSGESSNKGNWIMKLMDDYKKEPGGTNKLQEKNPKWINDDYVKFLRHGQYQIEKNGKGVVAFINPHGFLDNPTFRGMRWSLLNTYDKIYTIDLHGNSKKNETAVDGSIDENVFFIMQGVSINIFIKTGLKKTNELGKVFHYDLYGKRESKYEFLKNNNLQSVKFTELSPQLPELYFVPKDFELKSIYDNGFSLNSIFPDPAPGFVTCHDQFAISMNSDEMKVKIVKFIDSTSYEDASKNYKLCSTNQWNYNTAKNNLIKRNWSKDIATINYRPFDTRYTVFTSDVCTHRRIDRAMKHLYLKDNIGLIFVRQIKTSDNFDYVFLTDKIFESSFLSNKTGEITYVAPLYLYSDNHSQQSIEQTNERTPNLNREIINHIAQVLGLNFVPEKEVKNGTFSPIDIVDYIYGILHSPSYREKYKAFLKIDFPKIPYPKNVDTFWNFAKLGGEIRQLHLFKSQKLERPITQYPLTGTNVVCKILYKNGRVFINETQYFDNVPEVVWNFCIGGYQPAQKWLKDRKDRELQIDDIRHYMKIIVALYETDRLMKEIDKIPFE